MCTERVFVRVHSPKATSLTHAGIDQSCGWPTTFRQNHRSQWAECVWSIAASTEYVRGACGAPWRAAWFGERADRTRL
ncbi:hypothetical protein [Pandoravirus japonicus]|uniref:Uncharacterized protein n=1 Tax=Pandoravirus japonicus TaxID=2823154 RepID=A0A811BMG7_9VIRU|nr:hypothetical protein [Pandoravirus japonicus]